MGRHFSHFDFSRTVLVMYVEGDFPIWITLYGYVIWRFCICAFLILCSSSLELPSIQRSLSRFGDRFFSDSQAAARMVCFVSCSHIDGLMHHSRSQRARRFKRSKPSLITGLIATTPTTKKCRWWVICTLFGGCSMQCQAEPKNISTSMHGYQKQGNPAHMLLLCAIRPSCQVCTG